MDRWSVPAVQILGEILPHLRVVTGELDNDENAVWRHSHGRILQLLRAHHVDGSNRSIPFPCSLLRSDGSRSSFSTVRARGAFRAGWYFGETSSTCVPPQTACYSLAAEFRATEKTSVMR
jgi:hypothetical protein